MSLEGHGERSLLGAANHDLGEFGKQLATKDLLVATLNLAIAPEVVRSVWNDEPEDAELIIVSKVVPGGSRDDAEYLPDFWPE